MSMTKFTPGPWVWSNNNRFLEVEPIFNEYRGNICIICDAEHIAGITKVEAKSNAHLIAAAPDLYEALERLAILCDQNGHPDEPEEVSAARAALAKARGETVEGGV